jgi:aryl-alcohol dehydrogenase-like predicted oxidoreductase
MRGLAAETIRTGAEESLERLATDRIDLYYAHADDLETPIEETLREFDALVREGKVRCIGASNFTAARLSAALATSAREGLARYVALQPHYNLVVRNEYEGSLSDVCAREGVACVPYFALAMGFLTGKYRPGRTIESARAEGARKYLDARGQQMLAALDDIAAAHQTTVAAVSLAWLRDRPTVAAPIASARTVEQLSDLLPMATLTLTAAETRRLEDQ